LSASKTLISTSSTGSGALFPSSSAMMQLILEPLVDSHTATVAGSSNGTTVEGTRETYDSVASPSGLSVK
jgi:hypothetical protein